MGNGGGGTYFWLHTETLMMHHVEQTRLVPTALSILFCRRDHVSRTPPPAEAARARTVPPAAVARKRTTPPAAAARTRTKMQRRDRAAEAQYLVHLLPLQRRPRRVQAPRLKQPLSR